MLSDARIEHIDQLITEHLNDEAMPQKVQTFLLSCQGTEFDCRVAASPR